MLSMLPASGTRSFCNFVCRAFVTFFVFTCHSIRHAFLLLGKKGLEFKMLEENVLIACETVPLKALQHSGGKAVSFSLAISVANCAFVNPSKPFTVLCVVLEYLRFLMTEKIVCLRDRRGITLCHLLSDNIAEWGLKIGKPTRAAIEILCTPRCCGVLWMYVLQGLK